MLQLNQVAHTYPSSTRALQGVTLTVASGETLALIGRSGCGKSTLVKSMNGLVRPTAGSVIVNHRPLDYHRLPQVRRGIGYIVQGAGLFPHWTVTENINVMARLSHWDRDRIDQRLAELLDLVGLSVARFAMKYPHELSGGEQQRVGVARALMLDPPILLMDEPFSALDPITRAQLQEEFIRWKTRLHKTVVLVTHNMDEALRLGDRVALMEMGRILQVGTPKELADSPATRHVTEFLKGKGTSPGL